MLYFCLDIATSLASASHVDGHCNDPTCDCRRNEKASIQVDLQIPFSQVSSLHNIQFT